MSTGMYPTRRPSIVHLTDEDAQRTICGVAMDLDWPTDWDEVTADVLFVASCARCRKIAAARLTQQEKSVHAR